MMQHTRTQAVPSPTDGYENDAAIRSIARRNGAASGWWDAAFGDAMRAGLTRSFTSDQPRRST